MPRRARYRLDLATSPDWQPLEQVARLCRDHPELPELTPGEFMYMGRAAHRERPAVHLYKHIASRHYLNLDSVGHAYATSPVLPSPGDVVQVTCHPLRDLVSAVLAVIGPLTSAGPGAPLGSGPASAP